MELPEELNGANVKLRLIKLRHAHVAAEKWNAKNGTNPESGGYYSFLYREDKKAHLIKSLKSPGGFKKKRDAYYADIPLFEKEVRPLKKDFDPYLKLFCAGMPDAETRNDDEVFNYFEACVAVGAEHSTSYPSKWDGPVGCIGGLILIALIVVGGGFILVQLDKTIETWWESATEDPMDEYCRKYYQNYPGSTRKQCEASWKAIKEWDDNRPRS